jgi:hypothetical protein
MIQVFADPLEQHGSGVVSPEEGIAIPIISVPIRATVALVAAVALIATVVARARRAAILTARKITPSHAEGIF